MTRENKLALLVGFVVILVVGILVSDHFSTARSQRPADLLAISDPLIERSSDPGRFIDLAPAAPPPLSDSPRTTAAFPAAGLGPIDRPASVGMADPGSGRLPTLDPAVLTFHQVRPGESLSSICMHHYGSETPVDSLARYNDLSDPDLVRVGHRLRIPPIDELTSSGRPAAPAAPGGLDADDRTYTIRPGDSLTEIAQRLLGSAGRWHALYELNRPLISDPDEIPAGTVIKIP